MATTNVHIIGVGFDPKPIISIMRSDLPCDRIHLLWNDNQQIRDSRDTIVSTLINSGYNENDVMCDEVDSYDYQNILNRIMLISQIEKDRAEESGTHVNFYFNITHGTRLITGALCTASTIVGAQMYYLKEKGPSENLGINDLIIRIKIPRIPDLDKMTAQRRKFLKMICSCPDGMTVSELAREFSSKQNVNQFTGYFEDNNMVVRVHEGKNVRIKATELGSMAVAWLM